MTYEAGTPVKSAGNGNGILMCISVTVLIVSIASLALNAALIVKLTGVVGTLDDMKGTLATLQTGQTPLTDVSGIKADVSALKAGYDTPRIPLPGVAPATGTRVKLVLAQDIDWPPYAYYAVPPEGDYTLAGFGIDVATGLTSVCPHLEVTGAQTDWAKCWDDGAIGQGLIGAEHHGCMTYTHTAGERNRFLEFSNGILRANKPAGLLTRLDSNGNPVVKPNSNLSGVIVVDVVGWAPTADTLALSTNVCTGDRFSGFTMVAPPESSTMGPNDAALSMLLSGAADAMWVYADQAQHYQPQAGVLETWDTAMWEGFGTTFAYVHTGILEHSYNGTTLTISKKGSGLADIVNPCIQSFMETKDYYDLCTKHGMTSSCYTNSHFPSSSSSFPNPWELDTDHQTGACSTGYCSCSA